MRRKAQARNPYPRWWLWIPGSCFARPGMTTTKCWQVQMQFDTKIALVIRTDLEAWQKLNIAAFLAGGIAASFPECVGVPYEDGSETKYLPLIGQPILIYGADRATLSRALERALARNVTPALYTEDMFKTTHDEANRGACRSQSRRHRRARRAQGGRQDRRWVEVPQLTRSARFEHNLFGKPLHTFSEHALGRRLEAG